MSLKNITQKAKKHRNLILVLGVLVVISSFFFLQNFQAPASILQTGTGEVPTASIKHVSSAEIGSFTVISFNVTAQDPDNDIHGIAIYMWVETDCYVTFEGVNIWVDSSGDITIYSEIDDEKTPVPDFNPFSKVFALTIDPMLNNNSFGLTVIILDAGDNVIHEEMTSTVGKVEEGGLIAPSFEIVTTIVLLITITKLLHRKNKIEGE